MNYPKYEPGAVFGSWTIISKTTKRKVICKCACGNIKELYRTNLGSGKSISCGCSRSNIAVGTKLYKVWESMKSRCLNANHHAYENYGGRGVTVCLEWMDVETFYTWSLANGYKEGLSIDRIDNEQGYSPNNCKWSTWTEQHNNKRNNLFITFNGRTQTVAQWGREQHISNRTILSRIRSGWENEKLLIAVGGMKG